MFGTPLAVAFNRSAPEPMNRQRRVTELDLTQQQLLQETLQRRAVPLEPRERVAEAVAGAAFAAAAGALWLCFDVSGHWHPLAAVGCFVGLVFAMRIRFDAAGIYTMPGQLAFVPYCSRCRRRRCRPWWCSPSWQAGCRMCSAAIRRPAGSCCPWPTPGSRSAPPPSCSRPTAPAPCRTRCL